jgi:alkylation response protein AidB-like acyl-CoA dehydrogenase
MAGLAAVGEEIAAAGSSLLLIVVSPAIVGSILARHGTDAQKERWLRGIAAGTTKIAFAITEPDAGTNSHNLQTALRREGDTFVLDGQKTYISGVEHADAVLVVARTRLPDGSLGLPSLAIVDVDTPGFTRDPIPMPYLGPDQQWQLFFDSVEVEEERLIGGENGGLGPVFDGLNPERIMGAAIAGGAGRRALEVATGYARERNVWGVPIGAHQGLSHPLAQAKIELELARLMTQKAAALYDAGAPGAGEASNMAKYAAAEAAIKCVDQAIQTHGGNGFALEYGLSDMWWGVRLTRTAPVSREMILNYVAEHSLGLPKSY